MGVGTLAIVLRVFDQAKVVGDIAGHLLRTAALGSAGVRAPALARAKRQSLTAQQMHIFLESAICQSEEGEIVRGMYGVMAGVALV